MYTVGRDKQPMCQVKMDEKEVEMMVDSRALVDLIDENTFKELYKEKAPEKTKCRIFSYGSLTPLLLLGTVKAKISANANSTQTTLHIVKGASGNLLNFYTAKQLGVLKIVNQDKTDKTRFQSPTNREFESPFGAAKSIQQVERHPDQESCDVAFQPETQDQSDSRREPRRTSRFVGARR